MTMIDLARWEGWRTEPRDKRGRWTRGEIADVISKVLVAGDKKAAVKGVPVGALKAADAEMARRAALLGKPGQVSKSHAAIKAAIKTAPPAASSAEPGVSPEEADEAEKQAEDIKTLGRIGGKSVQLAVIKKKSDADLRAADYGLQQAAAATKTPKVTAAHQMVRDEIAKRGGKLADLTAPVRAQGAAEVAQREKKAVIVSWTTSYRYKGTSEVKDKRVSDFAVEMHRLLSTNKQPTKCGPGCQDAHKFLSMVDKEATVQPKELQRGLTLSSAAADRMFKPGKTLDMPVASWTTDPSVGAAYAKGEQGEGKPASLAGKTKVLIHAAPGAKGMDISSMSLWHGSDSGAGGEAETVTGGRMSVDKVETVNGVMNVYVTQKDFSAH
jgi:hypothetical protein